VPGKGREKFYQQSSVGSLQSSGKPSLVLGHWPLEGQIDLTPSDQGFFAATVGEQVAMG